MARGLVIRREPSRWMVGGPFQPDTKANEKWDTEYTKEYTAWSRPDLIRFPGYP